MKSKTKNHLVILYILLGFIGSIVGPVTSTANAAAPPDIQTLAAYGEWSARWWQWLLSIPKEVNPNLDIDITGENCGQGQHDDVWFLAGSFGPGVITRRCTIPAGKPIFFPLANQIGFKPWGYETLLDLRILAADFVDKVEVEELTCVIDGNNCIDIVYRARSPSFTVIAPPKGVVPPGYLSAPGNKDSIVSDGYWAFLPSLSVGTHSIQFSAKTNDGFELNITYNLIVE